MNSVNWAYWAELADGLADAFSLLATGDRETWIIIRQSLLVSTVATALAFAVGAPIGAWIGAIEFRGRGLLLTISNAGFGLPPVVVGLVLSILLLRHGPLGALNLRFTPSAMIAGQFVLGLPVVMSLTALAVRQLNPKLRLQMRALGASRLQTLWLLGREIRLPLVGACIATFGVLISEVGASQMLGGNLPGSTRVLTTAVVMETGMGNYDRAMAYGVVLLLLVGAVVGLLTWLQHAEEAARR